jgi:hypothetical protein
MKITWNVRVKKDRVPNTSGLIILHPLFHPTSLYGSVMTFTSTLFLIDFRHLLLSSLLLAEYKTSSACGVQDSPLRAYPKTPRKVSISPIRFQTKK